ncbi:MAG: PQQ-binding-like beta-propeller repeat protein, partial [Verrucomicrobia bacterium]|nr:PQQ-binding-like beta-propeller repeat protein [Verrucomicrobiota bacterium]
ALTGDWVDATPAVGPDGTVYVGSWDGKLYALSPAGVKKWEYATGAGNYLYSSPALGADGTIYFGAGDGNFYALRPDGTLKWTYPAGDWIDSSPAIGANGFIYYGSWDGNVYAIRDDGDTAREMWRFATNGPVLSSPALGRDGTVYLGANDGRLYALHGTTGARLWDFSLNGTLEGSPAVGPDGTVYFGGSDGRLHAVGDDGALRWTFDVIDPVVSTPAVRADGSIVFGTTSAAIYALNPDGSQKWRVTTGDWVDASPAIAPDGTIYVGSYDKRLYALNGSGSPASAFADWPMFRREPGRTARIAAPTTPGRLANLSTRAQTGPGINLIPGFVLAGSAPKPLLIRAVGPTLAQLGVTGALPDPLLDLHATVDGRDTVLAHNDNWGAAPNAALIADAALRTGAFALPDGSLDAAVLAQAVPRNHSVLLGSGTGASGLALVEVYDADLASDATRLINLSTRGPVGTGGNVLTLGFVITGPAPLRVLLRAIGPALGGLGVPGALARPTLTLFRDQTSLATNTGWSTAGNSADLRGAFAAAGAFALPNTSADSALLATLAPGAYTLQIAGVGGTTGEALGEIYSLP